MAWTTILASQTDADSPLNQVLFDAIRENLEYLQAQLEANRTIQLGGLIPSTGTGTYPNDTAYFPLDTRSGAPGVPVQTLALLSLPAAPSGKKWRLELQMVALQTGGATIRMALKDLNDADVAYVEVTGLTASYTNVTGKYIDGAPASAVRGRLVIYRYGGTTANVKNALVFAYLVDAT